MTKFKTMILDGKTVRSLVGIKEALNAVETAFRYFGQKKVQMPPKVYIHVDKYKGDFRAMPAYIEGLEKSSIKWVNVHPENKKIGLPTVMAIVILSDPKTGFPLCIMDGTYATALRTGAAGGIAAKYLARINSKRVALVGCGVQARTQLLSLNELFDIKLVKVWGTNYSGTIDFIKDIKKEIKIKIEPSSSVKDCVNDCDIIVTTTPSRKPLVKSEWIKKGMHINAIGADAKGKEELDPKILKKAKVVVDAWEQASHSGEINVPVQKGILSKKDIYADIGEIVAGIKSGRTNNSEITVFDSTGLAIQDTAMASIIYEKALRLKKGRFIELV